MDYILIAGCKTTKQLDDAIVNTDGYTDGY